jgi:hypothetical protein
MPETMDDDSDDDKPVGVIVAQGTSRIDVYWNVRGQVVIRMLDDDSWAALVGDDPKQQQIVFFDAEFLSSLIAVLEVFRDTYGQKAATDLVERARQAAEE